MQNDSIIDNVFTNPEEWVNPYEKYTKSICKNCI